MNLSSLEALQQSSVLQASANTTAYRRALQRQLAWIRTLAWLPVLLFIVLLGLGLGALLAQAWLLAASLCLLAVGLLAWDVWCCG